ncbi:hypothetical protein Ahy_A06g029110 [Arachis hypogaea]|uniref:Non-haem dioxygenase N-terminal domain-containing protein n=1 Tax=Arachis hypogaea TaxID=3818 RepID=A0A445CSE9_ARAHY|nr:hypothetical protein Ahy_A06g029110 [Arachis hypogaea]
MAKSIYKMSTDVKGNTNNSIGLKDSSSSYMIPIPIIDVSLLSSSEPEIKKLRYALTLAGYFQTIGHGMSTSYLHKICQVLKKIFQLPVEKKQKYARSANDSEGYGNDKINRRCSLWPQNPIDFRYFLCTLNSSLTCYRKIKLSLVFLLLCSEILEAFSIKVKSMIDYLLRCMARSLNMEEGRFLDQFGGQSLFAMTSALVLGLKPHTYRSVITVLLQDNEVEDEKLVNDLVANLGDQMQIMSNGIFKSPMHSVMTNKEKMRKLVAMSYEPKAENEIGPVESLITDTCPRLYKNVKNYGEINYRCY